MIMRKLLAAGSACGLLAAVVCGLLPAPAFADEPAAGPAPKVELVLDVSGSMRARDIDGQSRMSAAKQAFDDVLDSVPQGVQLGIRTLGANYPGNDRKTGCTDTRQLYPVGTAGPHRGQDRRRHPPAHRLDPHRPRAARSRERPQGR